MSNEQLVLLYQQGNKKTLESLIESNMGIIKKIAIKYNNLNKLIELEEKRFDEELKSLYAM